MIKLMRTQVGTPHCHATILLSAGIDFSRFLMISSPNHLVSVRGRTIPQTPSLEELTTLELAQCSNLPSLSDRLGASPSFVLWHCHAPLSHGSMKCYPPQARVLTAGANVHRLSITILVKGRSKVVTLVLEGDRLGAGFLFL